MIPGHVGEGGWVGWDCSAAAAIVVVAAVVAPPPGTGFGLVGTGACLKNKVRILKMDARRLA